MTVHQLINILSNLPPNFKDVEVDFSEKSQEDHCHVIHSVDHVSYGEYGITTATPFVHLKSKE